MLLFQQKKFKKNDYCFTVLRTLNLCFDNLFLNKFNIIYPTKASLQRVKNNNLKKYKKIPKMV